MLLLKGDGKGRESWVLFVERVNVAVFVLKEREKKGSGVFYL